MGQPAAPPGDNGHPGIEALIASYNLDARAAERMRALPRLKQDQVALIDLSKANKPSAYIMAQLQQLQAHDGCHAFSVAW